MTTSPLHPTPLHKTMTQCLDWNCCASCMQNIGRKTKTKCFPFATDPPVSRDSNVFAVSTVTVKLILSDFEVETELIERTNPKTFLPTYPTFISLESGNI